MREFFKGWRRKAGCVALVMACVLSGAWMRSLTYRDVFAWKITTADFAIRSFEGGLGWQRLEPSTPNTTVGWTTDSGRQYDYFDSWYTYESFDEVVTRIDWAGFSFGSAEWMTPTVPAQRGAFSVWIIPYWSIAVPLTLLSAYLILWKPRKKK